MKKRIGLVLVGVAGLLASCGSSDSASRTGSDGQSAVFNGADVTFVQGMIPHHQQAVEMAAMADTRASSAKVKDLAARISSAQGPEIKKMQGWLRAWGKDEMTDTTIAGSMDGMDGGTGMGMMSDTDMKSLARAQGAAFDTMFLTTMIAHHKGAITMAKAERESGKNKDAKALAEAIVSAQQSEITEMNVLLGK